jgi:hypothetical protein
MTTVKIPGLKLVSPNHAKHWAKQHKQKKKTAMIIRCLLNAHKWPSLPLSITLTRIAPRSLDYDNLVPSWKFLADCIGDCLIPGLAPGRADGTGELRFHYAQVKGKVREYAIEISIVHATDHCGTCPICRFEQEEKQRKNPQICTFLDKL